MKTLLGLGGASLGLLTSVGLLLGGSGCEGVAANDESAPVLASEAEALVTSVAPSGHVDNAWIDDDGVLFVQGWAKDADRSEPIAVDVYAVQWQYDPTSGPLPDRRTFLTRLTASGGRSDVGPHGFTFGVSGYNLWEDYLEVNNTDDRYYADIEARLEFFAIGVDGTGAPDSVNPLLPGKSVKVRCSWNVDQEDYCELQ